MPKKDTTNQDLYQWVATHAQVTSCERRRDPQDPSLDVYIWTVSVQIQGETVCGAASTIEQMYQFITRFLEDQLTRQQIKQLINNQL